MKYILLTQNKKAVLDDEDYTKFSSKKWFFDGRYASRKNNKEGKVYLHRLIMGNPNKLLIDHINRNFLDNRKSNLRICTKSQNGMNRSKQKNNTSGFKGVHWDKTNKRWIVSIKKDNLHINLNFINKVDAINKYNQLAKRYFGEFAYLNL